jgi:hypothetical protein
MYPLLCLTAGWAMAAMAESRPGRKHASIVAALAILATLGQVEYERSGRLYWKTRLDTLQSYRSIPALVQSRFASMGAVPPTLKPGWERSSATPSPREPGSLRDKSGKSGSMVNVP